MSWDQETSEESRRRAIKKELDSYRDKNRSPKTLSESVFGPNAFITQIQKGIVSNIQGAQPVNHPLTKNKTPAGEISLVAGSVIVTHPTDNPINLYWVDDIPHDGVWFFLTVEQAKTLNLNPGGSFDIADIITLTDSDFAFCKFYKSINKIKVLVGSAVGGQGANKTLSNLDSPTAINQHLIPGIDNTFDVGIFTKQWNDIFGEIVTSGTLVAFDLLDVFGNSDFHNNPLLNVQYLESNSAIIPTAGLIRAANNEIIIAARNFLNTANHGIKLNTSNKWEIDTHITPGTDLLFDIGEILKQFREIWVETALVKDLDIIGVVNGDLVPSIDDLFILGKFSPLQAWASAAIKQIVIPPGGLVNANNFSFSSTSSLGIINIPLNDSIEFQENGIPGSIGDIDATGLFLPLLNLDIETIVNRKSIFLLNFENDPVLDGEIALNGPHVKIKSGGLVRNISNIGTTADVTLWSQHPAVQVVDFATFRGKNGADPIEDQDFTTRAFVLGQIDSIAALSGIWTISQITHLNSKSIVDNGSISGVFFKPDGTKMYLARNGGIQDQDNITEYTLSTPWDVTTAVQANIIILTQFFFPHSATPNGVWFRSDGVKMYVAITKDDNNFPPFDTQHILEYTLSTPWNISTASLVHNEFGGQAVFFKPDGTRMFLRGHQIFDEFIRQHNLSTAWDITTEISQQQFQMPGFNGSPLRSLFIRPDGKFLFDCRSDNNTIRQWSMSAWDITSLSLIQTKDVSADLTSPQGIFFKPDGTRIFVINSTSVHTYMVGFV